MLLAVTGAYVWLQPAYVTMDGPAHLYNASLLNIHNNGSFVSGYLNKNLPLLPNYLSHLMIQLLLKGFDFLVAEKTLVTLIVTLLPLSFRWLIQTLTRVPAYYSFLIFPLVFTNLLQYGFYNFSLGLIFFNLHLCLTLKTLQLPSQKKWWLLLFINSFPLYFCHLFGYGLALLTAGIWLIWSLLSEDKKLWSPLIRFFILHLPTLVFAVIFLSGVKVPTYSYDLEPYEKTLGLISFTPAILFEKKTEMPYTILISLLLVVLSTVAFIKREARFNPIDLFMILNAAVLYLIFHTTDGALGGMFVQRLFIILFYFLIIWIACSVPVKGWHTVLAVVVVVFVFFQLLFARHKVMASAQAQVQHILEARRYIKNKSTVQSLRLSETWFHKHMSNYLGINKEVILFENYEAVLGWFPLSWKASLYDLNNNAVRDYQNLKPDYVFVYGKDPALQHRYSDTLRLLVNADMREVYRSADGFCILFERPQ